MRLTQLNSIFKHGHYNPANLGRALKALYGEAKLSDSLKSLIIPAYNIDGEQLVSIPDGSNGATTAAIHTRNNYMDTGGHALWLKNMKINDGYGRKHHTPDVSLYDAVMATTAAPTYFPCHHFEARWQGHAHTHQYTAIDGSIFDSPAVSYLGAIRQHLSPGQNIVMIGIGTGYTNRSIKKDDWNSYGSLGVVDPVNDLPLINIFFHAPESALLDAFQEDMGGNLYLFNKSLVADRGMDHPSLQIDDGSPINMKRLKDFADGIVEENRKQYETVCDLLVRNYESRQKWTEAAKPSRWKKMFGYLTK
jgi:uncharacterized protein